MNVKDKRRALGSKRWKLLRRQVLDRDGWRCCLCGSGGRLECDHIKPVHQGGSMWDSDNLQTLCRGCHIRKTRLEILALQDKPDLRRQAWETALQARMSQTG